MLDVDSLALLDDDGVRHVLDLLLNPLDGADDGLAVLLLVDLGERSVELGAPALSVVEELLAVRTAALQKLSQ